jgi:hypothetical protein
MKKVLFASKRAGRVADDSVDAFVHNRQPTNREPTKRFTIDVPVSLHKRIKSQCALENQIMADVIRELLEKQFPSQKGADEGIAS